MNRWASEPSNGSTKKKSAFMHSNPVMRRLDKVQEYGAADSCTYGGIAVKTIIFLLFSVGGIILERVLQSVLLTGDAYALSVSGFETTVYMGEIVAIGVCSVAGIILQLLAFFASATTPVTGSLYCVTQGYFISFLLFKVLEPYGYAYLGSLALAITMMIILVMAILYATGIIRVTKKFRMVMLTLVITSVGISLLGVIAYLIPFTRGFMASIYNNLGISITMSVIFIIIAALFLISDFDTIDRAVTEKMPKKYEWQAAFGLSFTVLWLYLKVLDLIMTIAGNNRD